MKLVKSKKAGMPWYATLIIIGVIGVVMGLYIAGMIGKRGGSSVDSLFSSVGDADGDGVMNKDDKCCPKACTSRPVDLDPSSEFYGCGKGDAPTPDCKAAICNKRK